MPLHKKFLIAVTAALAVLAFASSSAFASSRQVTIIQDDTALAKNPMGTLEKMKAAGATYVKYAINWRYMLADQSSKAAPAGSTGLAYYESRFGFLTLLDQDANRVGLKLQFLVSGPAPRWAEGPSLSGCKGSAVATGTCRPNAGYFAVFVAALGSYFNGSVPNVPAVRSWSFWNEPNYIINIAPQMSGGNYVSASIYRSLLDAAWLGLTRTGHSTRTDSILFGELAPRGVATSRASDGGDGAGVKPVEFLASLYCVTTSGRRFGGRTAAANGCPSSAATFRSQNPILFDASGVSDHPYSQGVAPTVRTADCNVRGVGETACAAGNGRGADPLWTDLAGISNLENGIDKDTRAEGAERKFSIWSTEYGYWVTPPGSIRCRVSYQADCDTSAANAAKYLNEAEYISYHNSRIASFDQYQLFMPSSGNWRNGLLSASGRPESTYGPWELPMWLPRTSLGRPGNVTVWGGVRPAAYYAQTERVAPEVKIQFKAAKGGWSTLKTQRVSTSSPGSYFTTSVRVSKSGSIRLLYTAGRTTLASRTQAVSVR